MTILVDASAMVAMATGEDEAYDFSETIDGHETRLCCAIGLWEASLAVARKQRVTVSHATRAVENLRSDYDLTVVTIGEDEAGLALLAHRRYGKGTGHAAKLNMGDCFAYACAKANGARLLYKGNDFIHTDLA